MSILIKGIDMPKDIDELRLIINGMSIAIEPTEVIQIPTPHGRLIDANKLEAMMYHEAFETDSDMQKWESGCWIRYKVFENCMNRLLPDTILETEE